MDTNTNVVAETTQPVPTSMVRDGDSEATRAAILAAEAEEFGTVEAEATAKPERPANVPEKFWDADKGEMNTEALLQSYGELESKLGAPKEDAEAKPEADPKDTPEDAAAKEIAEATGLDFEAYTAEFTENNYALTDGSREKIVGQLEKGMGLNKDDATALLDGYLEGLSLKANVASAQYGNDIKAVAGGDKAYGEMIAWAADNLSAEDIAEYDAAVNSGNLMAAKFAAKSLRAQFKADAEPDLIGGKPASKAGDSYASKAAMVGDMADPRYEKNAAYREEVDAKIARSVGNF